MQIKQIKGEILKYFKEGWKVQKGDDISSNFYFVSPRGYIFPDRKLMMHMCTICDDHEEYCTHSEENIAEEDRARTLYNLVRKLPGHYLPDYLTEIERD